MGCTLLAIYEYTNEFAHILGLGCLPPPSLFTALDFLGKHHPCNWAIVSSDLPPSHKFPTPTSSWDSLIGRTLRRTCKTLPQVKIGLAAAPSTKKPSKSIKNSLAASPNWTCRGLEGLAEPLCKVASPLKVWPVLRTL